MMFITVAIAVSTLNSPEKPHDFTQDQIEYYASLPALNYPLSELEHCDEWVVWNLCMRATNNPFICGDEPDC